MFSLEVRELTRRTEEAALVNHVSFSLLPGELFVILGPPQSGKTTLLRLIGGLEEPDSGSVAINGEDMANVPAAKRKVSILFQHGFGLIPHLDAHENIAFVLHHAVMSKDGKEYRISAIAKKLNIVHLLEKKASTLRVEEQMRIALARALVKDPTLYLFDDIFANFDTPTRLAARQELVEMQRAAHLSCIYVTSDPSDAFALANRIAVMHEGRIQQIGTRAELLNAPANLWIAEWLGSPPMNTVTGYLQGTYQPEGIRYRVWAKGFAPLLSAKWTRLLESLQLKEIILGIRPESIIPEWELAEKWKPSFYTVQGEVLMCEWNQGKTVVQLQLPNVDETFTADFALAPGRVKVGQRITLGFDPEDFRLFHPQTRQLLHEAFVSFEWNSNLAKPKKRLLLDFLDRRNSGRFT